jgi:pSer/pThr/pTyr-binding forkhead associated (FHA) protein
MPDWIVQDLIRACTEMDREAFSSQLGGPVLIAEAPRTGFSFTRGATTLKRDPTKPRFHRDELLQENQRPVLPLRQRRPGPQAQITIGRDRDNDVVVADPTISSRHAAFGQNVQTGTITLQDLGSTNGSWVNSRRLVAGRAITLFDGDTLILGDCKFFFFSPGGLYDGLKAALARTES